MVKLGFKKWGFLLLGTLFLMSSLLPGFSEQLNKLPALVNHYRHHVVEHDTASIGEFIELHYSQQSTHKTEEDHESLPLYHVNATYLLVVVQELPAFTLTAPENIFIEHADFKHDLYSFQNPGSIFQPPRCPLA
jgi:hypothetical protein